MRQSSRKPLQSYAILLVVFGSLGLSSISARVPPPSKPQKTGDRIPDVKQLRSVKGQVLYSPELPHIRLEIDKEYKYAGAQGFILFDNARTEQHFFLDADQQGRIRRMYWIQFEGYLPNNTYSYQYESTKIVKIGGLDFIADAFPTNTEAYPGRPGSDRVRAREFLEAKGFRWLSSDLLMQRLVHLADESKRSELMIIYAEDLSRRGLSAGDFMGTDSARQRMREESDGLLQRALAGLAIQP